MNAYSNLHKHILGRGKMLTKLEVLKRVLSCRERFTALAPKDIYIIKIFRGYTPDPLSKKEMERGRE